MTNARKSKIDLPRPVLLSEKAAQRVWKRAHDRAVKQYGEGKRAHIAGYDALKKMFTRSEEGDRWIRRQRLPARGITTELRSVDEPQAPYHPRKGRLVCQ